MSASAQPDPGAIGASRAFLARISKRYPVVEALLFGSRARGEGGEDSDVDVAVILDGAPAEMHQASVTMAADAFDILLDTGLLVTPIAISRTSWLDPALYSNPILLRNIRREGIAL